MSCSIAIPQRQKHHGDNSCRGAAATPSSTASSSSPAFNYGSFASSSTGSPKTPGPQDKASRERRPSLMSPSFTKAEHTVINIGDSDSPRLITCVKASQGFHWNQEIFLPSYADYHFEDLERKQDPVQDIFVTDEEVAKMFPS